MEQKKQLINDLTVLLKAKKYKKKKQTWYKENDDLIVVFNVQNSCYSDDYYINLGIMLKNLRKEHRGICITNCDIQERVPEKNKYGRYVDAEVLIQALELWEKWYGEIKSLRIKALEGKLPFQSTQEAISFLTTVRLA